MRVFHAVDDGDFTKPMDVEVIALNCTAAGA
jgi:hypothetical protein